MIELEIKVPCDDLVMLESRLLGMGAAFKEDLEQEDIYLASPTRDFGETDEALRLRRENERCRMTYKGPKLDKDTKMREEIELSIEDIPRMSMILERLGFTPVLRVLKRRTVYSFGHLEICLDRVDGLGDYVEIEYAGDDLGAGKDEIVRAKLGLGLEGNERRSYLELLLEKKV